MDVFVFSHQRGPYLENFLHSARSVEWEGRITVVDDGSSDPRTVEVLDRAERDGFEVLRRPHSPTGAWGGLQASMATALAIAQGPATLFAQDDLQLVRALRPGEEERIVSIVSDEANSPFLFPAFHMQSWKASRNQRNFRLDGRLGMPVRTLHHPLPGYSEVAIFSPERLRAVDWDPIYEEKGCSVLAYKYFGPMISYPYPFLAFVPFPAVPRRGLRYRLRHRKRLSTPAALKIMSDVEIERLFQRDVEAMPFATEWLSIRSRSRARLLGSSHWEH